MSLIGTLHEISMYGLIACIICLLRGTVTREKLKKSAFHPSGFSGFFRAYLFWASVLFIPIAVIGAFATKYADFGAGLSFNSSNIIVIMFAHIAEELQGLLLSVFWFLKDLFTHGLSFAKIIDYLVYFALVVYIALGMIFA